MCILVLHNYMVVEIYTVTRKERTFFQIIVTFFNFRYKKNYVNTKATCKKCSFDYLH